MICTLVTLYGIIREMDTIGYIPEKNILKMERTYQHYEHNFFSYTEIELMINNKLNKNIVDFNSFIQCPTNNLHKRKKFSYFKFDGVQSLGKIG